MVVILTREYKATDANAFDEIEDKINLEWRLVTLRPISLLTKKPVFTSFERAHGFNASAHTMC